LLCAGHTNGRSHSFVLELFCLLFVSRQKVRRANYSNKSNSHMGF
jgi:hypothetical protein